MDQTARIRQLEAENDDLRHRIEWLCSHDLETVGELAVFNMMRLTPTEAKIVRLLARRQMLHKELAYNALYGEEAGEIEPKILDVFICKIRPKLKPHGIAIETIWGRGWLISDDSKAKLRALIAEHEPLSVAGYREMQSSSNPGGADEVARLIPPHSNPGEPAPRLPNSGAA